VQGVRPSSRHSSDTFQGEIVGASPLIKEKSLCKKENGRYLFGRNHDPLQSSDIRKEHGR
jgi:hypothetical protein